MHRLGQAHGLFEVVRNTIRYSPSRTAWLRVGPVVGDFSRSRLGIKLMRSIQRVSVGVDIASSQLVQRTWLEMFRQSRVVVGVDVGVYSPVTGNRARHLRGNTPRDDVGTPLVVAGAEIEGRQGGRGAEQREQWEGSLATRPKWESELSQINRSFEKCAWELCLLSDQSSRAPSTCAMGRSSCRSFELWTARQLRELW